jgi:2-aminoadipate transaminase
MRLYQAKVVPVESDEGGLRVDKLEEAVLKHHPRMLYTIPTFQNPTGKTLFADRRPKIAALAEKYGFVVAEDDPYRDLRYAGTPLPSIKSYDKSGLVVFMGSFSKLISPGMRVGYIAAHPAILRKCVIGKQSADVHTATLNQAVVDAFFREDLLDSHVASICRSYSFQLSAMLEELSAFPEGTRYTKPEGGLFVWAELPEGINTTSLLMKAVERKVAYVPGTHFYAEGGHENTIRLNFSNSPIEKIHEGMTILKQVIAEAMQ